MSTFTVGLILGGFVPAVLYGLSAVFCKSSIQSGINIGWYLIMISITTFFVGLVFYPVLPDHSISLRSASYSVLSGACWALATGCVALALSKFAMPIATLVPIYNMNTLVAVVLGLWLFSEWQAVDPVRLLIGAVLIVLGGVLVSAA